jgi:iron complex outermembrane receptor protein
MSAKTDYRETNPQGVITEYRHVDLSFSPSVVGGLELRLSPVKNLAFGWQLKHVSKQFLDNTGNKNLTLDDYTTNDLRLSYLLAARKFAQVEFTVLILNLFNVQYESNGYVNQNAPYYYPQAGIHFMGGISARF